ncbi:MAG: hypothetical protein MJA29_04745, partial [Candidatus Omnitrophica bacterium]|nr:hypothetical protein [Candidatus Omnitrophota bacterium]
MRSKINYFCFGNVKCLSFTFQKVINLYHTSIFSTLGLNGDKTIDLAHCVMVVVVVVVVVVDGDVD